MSESTLITNALSGFKETVTGYAGVIGSDHAYIHKGQAMTAIINTGAISAAYDIAFTTPATGLYVHWRPIGISSSANYCEFQLTEDESFTGGAAVTPINRNRNSSTTSQMQAFQSNVTATPSGTIIQAGGIGSAGNPFARSGGGSAANEELVLLQDTTYLLTITPDGSTICNIEIFWYEETYGA